MGRGQIHHVLANPVYAGRIRHKGKAYDGQHDAIIDPERWEAMQARLMERSAKPRSKPAASHPSPLAGKFFDETGDRLTPSHAAKAGKRYRYYVSRRMVSGDRNSNAGAGWRLPADRLEGDLGRAVRAHLKACIECGSITGKDAGSIAQLLGLAEAVDAAALTCIETVHIGDGALSIDLNPAEIAKALRITPADISPDAMLFQLPFTQRRRGVETRFVIGAPQRKRDDILIANVARAEQWRAALCEGEDLATIAARDSITVKYLGEMLPFAFLSPKLVRAVLEGHQPPALTTNWIRRHGLPLSWADQDRIIAQL
jgi:hypothetical protein